jgi:hypothetical protein
MSDLKKATQTGGGQTGRTPPEEQGEDNRGAGFGTREEATRGTDRDLDRSGESKNPGHGHPSEERSSGDG